MRVANLMTRGENKNKHKQTRKLTCPSPFSETDSRKTPDCKVPF